MPPAQRPLSQQCHRYRQRYWYWPFETGLDHRWFGLVLQNRGDIIWIRLQLWLEYRRIKTQLSGIFIGADTQISQASHIGWFQALNQTIQRSRGSVGWWYERPLPNRTPTSSSLFGSYLVDSLMMVSVRCTYRPDPEPVKWLSPCPAQFLWQVPTLSSLNCKVTPAKRSSTVLDDRVTCKPLMVKVRSSAATSSVMAFGTIG